MSEPKDPYTEGYDAYVDGEPEDGNPYDSDTADHVNWSYGWYEAKDDEAEGAKNPQED